MKSRLTVGLFGLVGVAAGLLVAQSPPPRAERPATRVTTETGTHSQAPAKDFRIDAAGPTSATVGHLETRDRLVTITVGPNGPLYTVRKKGGRLLYENLTERGLRAKAPALYELVTGGYARNASGKAETLDASLRVSRSPR